MDSAVLSFKRGDDFLRKCPRNPEMAAAGFELKRVVT